MPRQYILNEKHEPVLAPDLLEWALWFSTPENRRVALDQVGPFRVSTVFLGLDHNFARPGPPVLFETMVFQNDQSMSCHRCCTWDEAVQQHEEMRLLVQTTEARTKSEA